MDPSSFAQQLNGARLTTIEILYHLPDHPSVLQTFVWQALDVPPAFPRLHSFLDYWAHNIDGVMHSVRVMNAAGLRQAEPRVVRHMAMH